MLTRTIKIDPYVTAPEIGELLGISRSRAWSLVREGRLLGEVDDATGDLRIPIRGLLEAALRAAPGRRIGRVPNEARRAAAAAVVIDALPRSLTVRRVAAALGVSDSRVRQLLARDQLAGKLIRGAWRIRRADLKAYLARAEGRPA